ncbi:MAG: lipoate--protein ligase [Eubacteriaceae bacterium]|jgi:lipoate-protein ligase A|nr:lipoate--protein ligase [Eubacteriaceae bacterium]
MFHYVESHSTDPYRNLAAEQYIFDNMPKGDNCFMLWQNDNTIVIGKNQNTVREINAGYAEEHGIRIARRLSGGGAVYHDLGNVNYTFIVESDDTESFDFARFCRPVAAALKEIGVHAEISGRNDMTIDGKKFSGNSQYKRGDRIMHHGTLMFDSDLDICGQALKVSRDKIESKGVDSVRSRVTNIRPYAGGNISTDEFKALIRGYMFREFSLREYIMSEAEEAEIAKLADEKYRTWEWNYGYSPKYSIEKERRIEGCGEIQVFMNVEAGVIKAVEFHGDYFGNGDQAELAGMLTGTKLERSALEESLGAADIGLWFHGLTREQFLSILLL